MSPNLQSMFSKKGIDKEKVKKLEKEIIRHRILYYQGNAEISDREYDNLEKELKELDPNNYLFNEVGFNITTSTFEKKEHSTPMLSLDKAYLLEEMENWTKNWNEKEQYSVGIKIDGFAISLIYELNNQQNNEFIYNLKHGITRGNGKIGENISENVKMIQDIPHQIQFKNVNLFKNPPQEIEIRGEIYMKKDVFKQLIEEKLIEENSRLRNIAPGSVRQKNPLITKRRNLNFFAYNLLNINFPKFSDKVQFIKELNIPVVPQILIRKNQFKKIYEKFVEQKNKFPFNIDGVVFRIDCEKLYESAGTTGHHPKGSIAWKFEAETEISKLQDVRWQTTRTGLINPVAMYEPVEVDGAILTQATLHNLSFIEELNIKIGSEIEVARQGGVIPKILRVVKSSPNDKEIEIPKLCPSCKEKTKISINHSSMNKTKTLHCTNLNCSAILKDKIHHFCSVLDIAGVSYSTIDKLFEEKLVKQPSDIFKLKLSDLLKLEGFKKRSSEKILQSIEKSKSQPFNIFLRSLGINGLGKTLSATLADKYDNLDIIVQTLITDADKIDGISEEMADKIVQEIDNMRPEIEELQKFIKIEKKNVTGTALNGKTFCITGTLSKGRGEFEKIIKENGGMTSSSVSKKIDYLLCGENAGSKLDKAKSLNIEVLNENEFFEILNNK